MRTIKILFSLIVLLAFAAFAFASPPDLQKTSQTTVKAAKQAQSAPVVADDTQNKAETACRDVQDNDFAIDSNTEFTPDKICENKIAHSKINYPIKS